MTFVTWAVYVPTTYTQQVWSIVYLSLGFVRTSYTINDDSALSFFVEPAAQGASGTSAQHHERKEIHPAETTALGT